MESASLPGRSPWRTTRRRISRCSSMALRRRRVALTASGLAASLYTFVTDSIAVGNANTGGVVVKSANLTTTYTAGADYTVDAVNGIVTRVAGGSIAGGATVAISYSYADVVTALAS